METIPIRKRKVIGVIGASEAPKEILDKAREVGRLIAERGGILLCGGLGGVMSAAAEGAKSIGGLTIGILPFYERDKANEFIDIVIATGMGHSRNSIIAASVDGLIAVGGSYGTLSEIAFGRKLEKPVMSLDSFEVRLHGKVQGDILAASTPKDAVSRLWKLLDGE